MEKLLKLLTLLGIICFFSIFMISGLVLTYNYTILLYESKASLSWSTCEGIITHHQIERRMTGGRGKSYVSDIFRYDYTIEGEKYTGDRYRIGYLGDPHTGQGRKLVDAHPVGTVVKVYYSPSSPAASVLVPGADSRVYILFVVGVVFILVSTYFVFALAREAVSVWVND